MFNIFIENCNWPGDAELNLFFISVFFQCSNAPVGWCSLWIGWPWAKFSLALVCFQQWQNCVCSVWIFIIVHCSHNYTRLSFTPCLLRLCCIAINIIPERSEGYNLVAPVLFISVARYTTVGQYVVEVQCCVLKEAQGMKVPLNLGGSEGGRMSVG